MTGRATHAQLVRALELSRRLNTIAEHGDLRALMDLDRERRQLLDSVRAAGASMNEDEQLVLRKIGELNDQAIGYVTHRRRTIEREMDTVTVGQRALSAYAATRVPR